MMPFIPLALIMTLTMAFVSMVSTQGNRHDASEMIGENLKFWHERAVRHVLEEGAVTGIIIFDRDLPFKNMAGWTSGVLDVNGTIYVATWPESYLIGGNPTSLAFAGNDYRRALHRISQDVRGWGFTTRTGILRTDEETGSQWVGYVDVTDLALPLQDGAMMIVTEFQ